ncbi:MAG: hypothetical protein ACRDSL_05425 [Pseudonocardiaceae bacterium]
MSVPMIIDTDPGVYDAVALLLAAACPEAERAASRRPSGGPARPACVR